MKTLSEILTGTELAAMTRPLAEASPPPAAYYTSQDLYDLEMKHIFHKDWLWVGHADDVRKPGDYFTFTYAMEPILVTRDQTGLLHDFQTCAVIGARL